MASCLFSYSSFMRVDIPLLFFSLRFLFIRPHVCAFFYFFLLLKNHCQCESSKCEGEEVSALLSVPF